jgi:hypothetical protein
MVAAGRESSLSPYEAQIFTMLCLMTGLLIGQTFRGSVSGPVTDASSAAVGGAAIRLVSPDTNLTREGVTSSAGEFAFQDLPLGMYDVTVTQSGFDTVHLREDLKRIDIMKTPVRSGGQVLACE